MRPHAFLFGLTCAFALAAAGLVIPVIALAQAPQLEGDRTTLEREKTLVKQGNFADAAIQFRAVIANDAANDQWVVDALKALKQCRNRLQNQNELDSDLQIALDNHASSHEVLTILADQLGSAVHYGVVSDQKFTRGYNRGYAGRGGVAGTTVAVMRSDWIRELRLRRAAIAAGEQARLKPNNVDYCRLHMKLAETILRNRSGNQAWALQSLTDLDIQLDYTTIDGDPPTPTQNAPVDESGEPVYYSIPDSWETAKSDGERLRWTLEQAKKVTEPFAGKPFQLGQGSLNLNSPLLHCNRICGFSEKPMQSKKVMQTRASFRSKRLVKTKQSPSWQAASNDSLCPKNITSSL